MFSGKDVKVLIKFADAINTALDNAADNGYDQVD